MLWNGHFISTDHLLFCKFNDEFKLGYQVGHKEFIGHTFDHWSSHEKYTNICSKKSLSRYEQEIVNRNINSKH